MAVEPRWGNLPRDHQKLHSRLSNACWNRRVAAIFEVAYHVLGAALHCAEELKDLEMAVTVRQRAERQQAELDRTEPPHPLSTVGAARRGTHPLFASLERTAHAAGARIKAQLAQDHAEAVRRRHMPSGRSS